MLENVHLAPGWLMQLEKKLHSMQPHASFRLFLTMEINPKVGITITADEFWCLMFCCWCLIWCVVAQVRLYAALPSRCR